MSEELKPCPGCAGSQTRVIGGPGTAGGPKYWAGCDYCHWRTWGDTEAEAIAAWNSRAALKDRDVVLEEAAKVAGEYHSKWSVAGGFAGHTAAARVIAQAIRNLKERV